MEELLNKVVKRVFKNDDNDFIVFEFEEGFAAYNIEGGCCSSSYIQSINNLQGIIGNPIIEISAKENVSASVVIDEDSHIDYWGYSITSTKGICDIEFRDESNGYYSGEAYYQKGFSFIQEDGKFFAKKTIDQYGDRFLTGPESRIEVKPLVDDFCS